jgi:hypothetical protein
MGYVYDTAMAQFIPPTAFHIVTGTWTMAAGSVAGTIALHKAAAAETAVVTIPVTIPSNSVALKGAKLLSVELDYEILVILTTSVTPVLNSVARGADTAVAVVTAVTQTCNLVPATTAATLAKHKMIVTVTTPAWVLNTQYYLLQVTFVAVTTATIDLLGAVANFALRL